MGEMRSWSHAISSQLLLDEFNCRNSYEVCMLPQEPGRILRGCLVAHFMTNVMEYRLLGSYDAMSRSSQCSQSECRKSRCVTSVGGYWAYWGLLVTYSPTHRAIFSAYPFIGYNTRCSCAKAEASPKISLLGTCCILQDCFLCQPWPTTTCFNSRP